MSHPRLSRRGVLIGGVAALAAVGGGSSWALDRFVIDHPQVSNVSDLEAQASSTSTSAPSVAAGEPTIAVTTWTQGSGTDKVTGYVADVTTPDASFLRTASSSTWVPRTLVFRNAAASIMLRSTCVSAAKFTTTFGEWSEKTASTAAASATSPFMNV